MALPIIRVNSSTGSDTTSSGAGPGDGVSSGSTLSGTTNASSSGTGLVVTLPSGTNLANVATDGSHVLFFNDSTAGNRNFGKITATSGSGGATPQVTVADAFGLTVTNKSWAIGGKRATIAGTNSAKLFSNNSLSGDAMPGWTVEMESGYTETIAATYSFRRLGDTTDGPIFLKGTDGLSAANMPVLTFSNNGNCLRLESGSGLYVMQGFRMKNSNATKTASIAIQDLGSTRNLFRNIGIDTGGSLQFWKGFDGASGHTIVDCFVAGTASYGIGGSGTQNRIINTVVHSCGGNGVNITGGALVLIGCLLYNNTGDGCNYSASAVTGNGGPIILNNTFNANGGDGFELTSTPAQVVGQNMPILNNIFSNNGGYGLNFSGAGISDATLEGWISLIAGNDFYNNTSGKYNPTTLTVSEAEQTLDPQYTAPGSFDYSIGTNLKAKGYPLGGTLAVGGTVGGSGLYSYVDIGAFQRQEAAGAGPVARALVAQNIGTY